MTALAVFSTTSIVVGEAGRTRRRIGWSTTSARYARNAVVASWTRRSSIARAYELPQRDSIRRNHVQLGTEPPGT